MHRAWKFLGTLGVATASCSLAYLTARVLVLDGLRALLVIFTDADFYPFRVIWALPGVLTRYPPDTPALYSLYHGGFLLCGTVVLLAGTLTVSRSQGWLRLFLTQVVVWSSVLLALTTGLFVIWSRGSLSALLHALWPAQAFLPLRISFGILMAALVFPAAYLTLRHLLDSAADTPGLRLLALGRWVLLPAGIVSVVLTTYLLRWWSLLGWGVTLGILLLILLAGLPAAVRQARPAPPFRPGFAGAVVLLLAFGLALGGLYSFNTLNRLVRRSDFSEFPSQHWQLHFKKDNRVEAHRAALGAAADERLAAMAQRLGLELPNPSLHIYLHTSTETKNALVESDEPFTVEPARREVHHLLAPDGGVSDARGDALLLMHAGWGEGGSEAVTRALARYAVGSFHGSPLADSAARITREEGPYSLREIFQLDTNYLSPLVRDALGGAWVEFLGRRRGWEILPVLYRELLVAGAEEKFAHALGSSWESLEREWRSYQLATADRPLRVAARPRPAPFFHRGISFSHTVGGDWGYGSDRAQQELVRIQNLGANAIAIVPYAFTRPRELRFFFRTSESDARVIRT
ncbi:MAG: hypothetical protein ACE5MH_06735, partial [Terriglobia bacterium]